MTKNSFAAEVTFTDTFLTVHLEMTPTEICRVSLLTISFFVSLGKPVMLQHRCLKKISVLESLLNKVTGLMGCNFIKKETPTLVFSCKYQKMFKKSFFYGTPLVDASENG